MTMPSNWIIQQQWNHVLFLSWFVDPRILQPQVPFELDLIDGQAMLSVVPFQMNGIRFRFTPVLPLISSLMELNLRTYVRHNGKSGIYFFTLDTNSLTGNWIARTFFKLPYHHSRLTWNLPNQNQPEYGFSGKNQRYELNLRAERLNPIENKSALDHWVTERYHLFLQKQDQSYRGDVYHKPWNLHRVGKSHYQGNFTQLVGYEVKKAPDHLAYGTGLTVRFTPFQQIL